jgi:hypothetical protein
MTADCRTDRKGMAASVGGIAKKKLLKSLFHRSAIDCVDAKRARTHATAEMNCLNLGKSR